MKLSTLIGWLWVRAIRTDPDLPANQNSRLHFQVQVTGLELKRCLLNSGQSFFWNQDPFAGLQGHVQIPIVERLFNSMFDSDALLVDGVISTTQGYVGFRLNLPDVQTIFPGQSFLRFDPNVERNGFSCVAGNVGAGDPQISSWFVQLIGQSIYKFDAERLHIGTSQIDNVTVLKEDGSNLAQVLLKLKEDDQKFQEYLSCVKSVLPNLTGVVPTVFAQNTVGVEIQFHDPILGRRDLNIGLRECGTGTSQVLCILYVVVTSRHPKIVIIDEPNSFLHPGAAKRLIEVLKNYTQHQFIIATHSPELIQVAEPDNLLLVKWSDAGSVISDIDRKDIEAIRFTLGDLGVGLSDVFGLERAIWVEGPTEAACFPILLQTAGFKQKLGVGFVPLRAVGDITGSEKAAFFEIYSSLVVTSKILPTAVAFSLDSEELSDRQKEDLSRQLGNLLHFLPRRCFENYLLHPEALSALFVSVGEQVTAEHVQNFLSEKRSNQNLDEWLNSCNGARVLKEMFAILTEHRHQYFKIRHGQALVEWLLQHDRAYLNELSTYVLALCEGSFERIVV